MMITPKGETRRPGGLQLEPLPTAPRDCTGVAKMSPNTRSPGPRRKPEDRRNGIRFEEPRRKADDRRHRAAWEGPVT